LTWYNIFQATQVLFLAYFICLSLGYLLLNVLAFFSLKLRISNRSMEDSPHNHIGFELPISLIAPAYNEEATIAASIRSLLQLHYSEYEIIVVNDGSKDNTLAVLQAEFELVPFPEAYRRRLTVKHVRNIYRSKIYPNLKVIDKENGGKADALNAGINAARHPLFCAMDADSVLQRDSLRRLVVPFIEDPDTIVAGGTVRIANGCDVRSGFLHNIGLPSNPIALIQVTEYLRAFLFGRLGWSPMNAVLIVSGAFGLFRKDVVVAAGGYRTDTVGEDMELIVRLHRTYLNRGEKYRIIFLPDPVCWTEAPESLKVLKNQRVRWQRGLAESLFLNRGLLFHRRGGAAAWLAFPFMLIFECFGPLLEVTGYVALLVGYLFDLVSLEVAIALILIVQGFGLMISTSALLLEEMAFHMYPKAGSIGTLLAAGVIENFGYRQLITFWRLLGLMKWLFKTQSKWGEMTRSGTWQKKKT
jgi:cellulose synthase/poly-beta-1,6-N-acetylglucosamine synthase-like glycosyltransferase